MVKILTTTFLVFAATLIAGCSGQPTDDYEGVSNPAPSPTPAPTPGPISLLISDLKTGGSVTDVSTSFVLETAIDLNQDTTTDVSTSFVFEPGFNRSMNSAR